MKINFIVLILLLSSSLFAWENIDGGRGDFNTDSTFHLLYGGSGNALFGDFNATGNSILWSNNPTNASLINDTTSYKVEDTDFSAATYTFGDSEKDNSSSAKIILPAYVKGSDIVWAGLFWQGHVYRQSGTYDDDDVESASKNWNKVTIKDAKGNMHAINAPIGSDDLTHKAFYHSITSGTGFRHHYGAYHEITDIVKNSYSSTDNTFTVGNIKTTQGKDDGGYVYVTQAPTYSGNFRFGLYGGWSIIVVYNVDGPTATTNDVDLKNVTIYDGFDLFLTWGKSSDDPTPFETTIDLNGFITPKTGTVNSKMLLFGGAGDRGIEDDTLAIRDKLTTNFNNAANSKNLANEQFNHTYTYLGKHMDSVNPNKQGMDLDIYDVSSSMTNDQTETQIKFGVVKSDNHCDQIFPQVIGFSTTLFKPQFCYDYGYQQNGTTFTEVNTDGSLPRITGYVTENSDINVTLYIKNLEDSDISATNVTLNIKEINATQAVYNRNTVYITYPNKYTTQYNTDAGWGITATDTTINGIPASDRSGTNAIQGKEGSYIKYALTPQYEGDINMSINAEITYLLKIPITNGSTVDIPYTSVLGSANMPLCVGGGYDYRPEWGIYSFVQPSYYANNHYNITTQTVKRSGDFAIASFDPTNLNQPLPVTDIVRVELVDVGLMQDANSSCGDVTLALGDSALVSIIESSTGNDIDTVSLLAGPAGNMYYGLDGEHLTTSQYDDMFQKASKTAAWRVWFLKDPSTGDKLQLTCDSTTPPQWNIWEDNVLKKWAQDLGCSTECNSAASKNFCDRKNGNSSGKDDIKCLACLYKTAGYPLCSRDNFAIRPESFNLKLTDDTVRFAADRTGVLSPNSSMVNLAAGYDYHFDVNATSHIGNSNTEGYTRYFGNNNAEYNTTLIWEPTNTLTGCNDTTSRPMVFNMIQGVVSQDANHSQVGEYRLNMIDKTWTAVDWNPLFMPHHTSSDFRAGTDCRLNSNSVPNKAITVNPTNFTTIVGCDINSTHTNADANLQYKDYKLTFHPYTFDLSLMQFQKGNIDAGIALTAANAFVYQHNIENNVTDDPTMASRYTGPIRAVGENNLSVSNFVTDCYAKDLDLTVDTSNLPVAPLFSYRLRVKDSSNAIVSDNINGNNAGASNLTGLVTLPNKAFEKSMNGVSNVELNLNFNRAVDTAINPIKLTYNDLNVTCTGTECQSNADQLPNYTPAGIINTNLEVIHLYGRAYVQRHRAANQNANVPLLYEFYCNDQAGSLPAACSISTYSGTVSPNALHSPDDIRWYSQALHNTAVDGNVSATDARNSSDQTRLTTKTINADSTQASYTYDASRGFPYKTTVQINTPDWLIYSRFDNSATINNAGTNANTFELEFYNAGNWAGQDNSNMEDNTNASSTTNRRIQW